MGHLSSTHKKSTCHTYLQEDTQVLKNQYLQSLTSLAMLYQVGVGTQFLALNFFNSSHPASDYP